MKKSLGAKTLIYPAPVLAVGTYDKAGKANVMTPSWGGICCSQPPCMAISLRKATYSYQSILDRKAFTISIPSEEHLKAADYFGLVSGRAIDKFAVAKLTAVRSKLADVAEIGMHTQFVGGVLDVKAEDSVIGKMSRWLARSPRPMPAAGRAKAMRKDLLTRFLPSENDPEYAANHRGTERMC